MGMLTQVRIVAYKAFNDLTIDLERYNVFVGPNNAGKSTLMEAISLVAYALRLAPYMSFVRFVDDNSDNDTGFFFDLPEYISQANLRHNYDSVTAHIYASFSDGLSLHLSFPPDNNHTVKLYYNGISLSRTQSLPKTTYKQLFRVPPVGPLQIKESFKKKDTIRDAYGSHLTPQHFRNYWYYHRAQFDEFRQQVQEYIPSLAIEPPELDLADQRLYMDYREDAFGSEIAWAGHGYQIWLQLLTHILEAREAKTIILDEPDIFLHSDLQRRLVRMLKESDKQLLIATHAVDIISEFDPDSIVLVEKSSSKAVRVTSNNEVQALVQALGAGANVHYASLLRATVLLALEGDDFRILQRMADTLELRGFLNRTGYTLLEIGGFDNWRSITHLNLFLKNILGADMQMFLVLDRDCRTNDEIERVKKQFTGKRIRVRVWNKKEIENYLINITVITRAVNRRLAQRGDVITDEVVLEQLLVDCTEEMKEDYECELFSMLSRDPEFKKLSEKSRLKRTKELLSDKWETLDSRLDVLGGKELLSRFNRKLQDKLKVSLTAQFIASEFKEIEIHAEIKKLLKEIDSKIFD